MLAIQRESRDEHFESSGPKRILSLDGGGVRGVLTLGVLRQIEGILRSRHGDARLRLCDYFDLIAGTSTGAIIAAALAQGMSVNEVQTLYRDLARRVFDKSLFRQGMLRAKYSAAELTSVLKQVFGEQTTLGSDTLRTGLLVVMKRADTGSPWPVSNNPKGKYYAPHRPLTIPNKDYPLWSVVRASTAAPSYFDPEHLLIAQGSEGTAVTGTFVDGGVSVANNPSLLALRFATLQGYGISWPVGDDKLLLVSVGTGTRNLEITPSGVPGYAAVQALLGLMDDCNSEVETMMQWLGRSDTARIIDREIQSLENDDLAGQKMLTYQRYNVELSEAGLNRGLELGLNGLELDAVQEMDAAENVEVLERIGDALGRRVVDAHFPKAFDRTKEGASR